MCSPISEWNDSVQPDEVIQIANTSGRRINRLILKRIIKLVMQGEGAIPEEIVIALVDNEEITRVNREHLSHDRVTDVISFTYQSQPLNGEVVVSVEQAFLQAGEFGVPPNNELARLLIHGILHLNGHEDSTPARRKRMSGLEDHYLTEIQNQQGIASWLLR